MHPSPGCFLLLCLQTTDDYHGDSEPRHGQLYVSLFAVVVGWIEVKLKTHGADEATPHARLSAPGFLPTLEESHGESEPESIPHDTDTGQHG